MKLNSAYKTHPSYPRPCDVNRVIEYSLSIFSPLPPTGPTHKDKGGRQA